MNILPYLQHAWIVSGYLDFTALNRISPLTFIIIFVVTVIVLFFVGIHYAKSFNKRKEDKHDYDCKYYRIRRLILTEPVTNESYHKIEDEFKELAGFRHKDKKNTEKLEARFWKVFKQIRIERKLSVPGQ